MYPRLVTLRLARWPLNRERLPPPHQRKAFVNFQIRGDVSLVCMALTLPFPHLAVQEASIGIRPYDLIVRFQVRLDDQCAGMRADAGREWGLLSPGSACPTARIVPGVVLIPSRPRRIAQEY